MELQQYWAVVLNLQESYHLEKATGCDVDKLEHVCLGKQQASLLPAVLGKQMKESMNYPGVMFSNQLGSSSF